jgi:hypothetical protein
MENEEVKQPLASCGSLLNDGLYIDECTIPKIQNNLC